MEPPRPGPQRPRTARGLIAAYRKSLQVRPSAAVHSNLLLALHYVAETPEDELRSETQAFGQRFLPCRGQPATLRPRPSLSAADRPVRIGYLSPDLREHSVAYFAEALLRHHDRSRFDIRVYSDARVPDDVTRELAALVGDGWRDTPRIGLRNLAAQIDADGVDLLVDLAGHTAGNRLGLFDRSAFPASRRRLHLSYLGYFDATGVPDMDLRGVDRFTAQHEPGDQGERLLVLPEVFACYTPPRAARQLPPGGSRSPARAGRPWSSAASTSAPSSTAGCCNGGPGCCANSPTPGS